MPTMLKRRSTKKRELSTLKIDDENNNSNVDFDFEEFEEDNTTIKHDDNIGKQKSSSLSPLPTPDDDTGIEDSKKTKDGDDNYNTHHHEEDEEKETSSSVVKKPHVAYYPVSLNTLYRSDCSMHSILMLLFVIPAPVFRI